MLYLLAIVLPPVAVLLVGKPIQAVLNLFLTLLLWIPGIIHAILVINQAKAEGRLNKQLKQAEKWHRETLKAMERERSGS